MFICLRQVDLHRRFGIPRVAFLSLVTFIITFMVSFEIMYYFLDHPLTDRYFLFFVIAFAGVYPIHKLCHLILFIPYYKSFRCYRLSHRPWLPFYNVYINTPIWKPLFCLGLLAPLIIITPICIYLAQTFPSYGHYYMFIMSLNFGCAVLDLLYLKLILFSTKGKFIEEYQTGLAILDKK